MIGAVILISQKGELLCYRLFQETMTRAALKTLARKFTALRQAKDFTPVCRYPDDPSLSILSFQCCSIYFVAIARQNVNATMALMYLAKLSRVLEGFFGHPISEETIRSQPQIVLELLDETIDYGIPQIVDYEILKKYVTSDTASLAKVDQEQINQIAVQATGAVNWRPEGIFYKKNEVYLDVVESVDVLVSSQGQVLRSEVVGQVLVKSKLSGMPECKFGMNDKLVIGNGNKARVQGGIALEDVRFHHCVKLSKFDHDRSITFIPADGMFELMTYRVTTDIQLPFRLIPMYQEHNKNKLEISVKLKTNISTNLSATNVTVKLPVPPGAARVNVLVASIGRARYEPAENALMWRIKRIRGDVECTILADVEVVSSTNVRGVDAVWGNATKPPIALDFRIPMFTASGLVCRFLRIQEKSNYKVVKWIRYITKAGMYHHRV